MIIKKAFVQDTGCVGSEEGVVRRARHAHARLEKTEHDRLRRAAASHPSLRSGKEGPMMLIRCVHGIVLSDFQKLVPTNV